MTILILTLIYFIFLFFYIFRRNGFDVAAFMALLYIISTFFAILLGLMDTSNYHLSDVSFLPTFIYCLFLTLLIIPFYKYNTNKARKFNTNINVYLFNGICYFFIGAFFLELIVSLPILISRFNASPAELAYLRVMYFEGDGDEFSTGFATSGISHILYTLLNVFTSASPILIIFFFFSICFLNKSFIFNALLLICSMKPFIYSVITIDRHAIFFWLLSFAILFLVHKQYIVTRKQKAYLGIISFIFCLITLAYMLAITIARFGDSDSGTGGGLLSYAGQSIYNNSILWDNLPYGHFDLKGILPISSFVLEDIIGFNTSNGDIYSMASNISLNGFNTILGYFVRAVGRFWAVVFLFILNRVTHKFVMKGVNDDAISLYNVGAIFCFGIIVECGFISYYYDSWPIAVGLWIILFLTKKLNSR